MVINTSDFAPVSLGISALQREETKRDGSTVMVGYVRVEYTDPSMISRISEKGNKTVASVGQKAILPPVRFPVSGWNFFPNLSLSVWGKVEE